MRAKDYLSQIKRMNIHIGQRVKELNQMREEVSLITGIDYSKDVIQKTPLTGNKQIEAIVDLEAQIMQMVEKELTTKNRIIGEIQTLDNPVYVDILFRRYVDCLPFERISCDMGYAYNYVCTLHGEALKEFEDKVLNLS